MVNSDYSWVYSVGHCVCIVLGWWRTQQLSFTSRWVILPAAPMGGGQEAATHLDSSSAQVCALCTVSVLCDSPSPVGDWKWLECRLWTRLIINTSSQADASRHNTVNASKDRLSQEGDRSITVTAKANGEHTPGPRIFTGVMRTSQTFVITIICGRTEKGRILMAYARTLLSSPELNDLPWLFLWAFSHACAQRIDPCDLHRSRCEAWKAWILITV